MEAQHGWTIWDKVTEYVTSNEPGAFRLLATRVSCEFFVSIISLCRTAQEPGYARLMVKALQVWLLRFFQTWLAIVQAETSVDVRQNFWSFCILLPPRRLKSSKSSSTDYQRGQSSQDDLNLNFWNMIWRFCSTHRGFCKSLPDVLCIFGTPCRSSVAAIVWISYWEISGAV